MQLSAQIQREVSEILEDYERRLYSLEEDRRRMIANYRDLETRCTSAERRISELLYKFADLQKR